MVGNEPIAGIQTVQNGLGKERLMENGLYNQWDGVN
jgi:hypothetical protein